MGARCTWPDSKHTEETMCEKAQPVARLTVTHRNGQQTIVEVHDDASFTQFYRWYKRNDGQKTKNYMRSTNRVDARDLEHLAAKIAANWKALARHRVAKDRWNGHLVDDWKVVVLDAEKYVRFLDCDPSELPGGGMAVNRNMPTKPAKRPEHLPIGYTPLQKRMDILTGRA
jgi:hypothetical protein